MSRTIAESCGRSRANAAAGAAGARGRAAPAPGRVRRRIRKRHFRLGRPLPCVQDRFGRPTRSAMLLDRRIAALVRSAAVASIVALHRLRDHRLLGGGESGRRRGAEAGEQLGLPRLGARQVRLLDVAEAADLERQPRQFDRGGRGSPATGRARSRRARLRTRRSDAARCGARRCGRTGRTAVPRSRRSRASTRNAPSIHGP